METEKYLNTIALLRKEIRLRDSDIQKAATFGKQLLEDKEKLTDKIDFILSENEALKQDKYSLQIDLETQVQTVKTQSSELEIQREQFDTIKSKVERLQKENITQKQQISNLSLEKSDLDKIQQETYNEVCAVKKKNVLQEQQIRNLQYQAEISHNISVPEDHLDEHNDVNYYKLQNKQLQQALSEMQYELQSSKLEETKLLNLIKELQEGVNERDREIKEFSVEMQKSRDAAAELQGEIEILKLDQLDVNRRGNSVFGELDDRRKYVEKEYKLLSNRYENVLRNFENNKQELSKCKGQLSILLSMTSRTYQDAYIEQLEDNLGDSRREIENLTAKLGKEIKSHHQQMLRLEQVPAIDDEYAYLRVLCGQAENKIKTLENELITLRMQNINDKESLTKTQQYLYQTQEELDSVQIENMKLTQQIKELTMKPDAEAPVKSKPRIEILPGYKPTPEGIKIIEKVKNGTFNENKCPDDIIPGELLMTKDGFVQIKPPRRKTLAILRDYHNRTVKVDEKPSTSPSKNSMVLSSNVDFLKDSTEKETSFSNADPPSYARYKSSQGKNRNAGNCTQQ